MQYIIAIHFCVVNPSEMNQNDVSKRWWESPNVVIAILTVVAGAGLVSVSLPLGLSWSDVISSKNAQFYVTEVGVPLLTFSGFLTVYLGFLSQRQQNELQKEQLKKQQQNFQKDRFESTFFQLLRTQNQIVNDIRIEQTKKTTEQTEPPDPAIDALVDPTGNTEAIETIPIHGRSCFEHFYDKLEEIFWRASENKDWSDNDKADESKVRSVYLVWFRERESQLNHYFNHLCRLISFVHHSDIEDRKFYIDLITAQMSLPEQKLFFYHVNLMKKKSEHRHLKETYDLLNKYTFFKQIGFKSLIHKLHYELNREALGVE